MIVEDVTGKAANDTVEPRDGKGSGAGREEQKEGSDEK